MGRPGPKASTSRILYEITSWSVTSEPLRPFDQHGHFQRAQSVLKLCKLVQIFDIDHRYSTSKHVLISGHSSCNKRKRLSEGICQITLALTYITYLTCSANDPKKQIQNKWRVNLYWWQRKSNKRMWGNWWIAFRWQYLIDVSWLQPFGHLWAIDMSETCLLYSIKPY